jgi:sugar O-acyltransferase (sialic acid O-acetyltransferase NeuD family)
MNVVVIGGSDQGRQVIDAIEARADHIVVGVLDRAFAVGTDVVGYPVLGRDDELAACAGRVGAEGYVVAIGDNTARAAVLDHADHADHDLTLITVAHPAAVVARDATIGAGSILLAGSVVSNGCDLGRGVLLGTRASVDHDTTVGDHASVGPGATTGGHVRIGPRTAVGLGASVVHGVTIGAAAVIGAGAVVLGDVPDLVVAYGVPARVARSRRPGEPYL